MLKGFVRCVHQGGEFVLRERGRDKGQHDFYRELLVAQSTQRTPFILVKLWPRFRKIESAITCKSRQQHFIESEGGGFTASTYITHDWISFRARSFRSRRNRRRRGVF